MVTIQDNFDSVYTLYHDKGIVDFVNGRKKERLYGQSTAILFVMEITKEQYDKIRSYKIKVN